MLSIRRCPTQLSIHQDDQEVSPTSIVRQLAAPGAWLANALHTLDFPAAATRRWGPCSLRAGAGAAQTPRRSGRLALRLRYGRLARGTAAAASNPAFLTSCRLRCAGCALPLLRFAVHDTIAKRLRSFGDLQSVLDLSNAPRHARPKPRPRVRALHGRPR